MLDALITLVIDREHAQAANGRHGAQTPPGGLCIRCARGAGATATESARETGRRPPGRGVGLPMRQRSDREGEPQGCVERRRARRDAVRETGTGEGEWARWRVLVKRTPRTTGAAP